MKDPQFQRFSERRPRTEKVSKSLSPTKIRFETSILLQALINRLTNERSSASRASRSSLQPTVPPTHAPMRTESPPQVFPGGRSEHALRALASSTSCGGRCQEQQNVAAAGLISAPFGLVAAVLASRRLLRGRFGRKQAALLFGIDTDFSALGQCPNAVEHILARDLGFSARAAARTSSRRASPLDAMSLWMQRWTVVVLGAAPFGFAFRCCTFCFLAAARRRTSGAVLVPSAWSDAGVSFKLLRQIFADGLLDFGECGLGRARRQVGSALRYAGELLSSGPCLSPQSRVALA